MRDEELTNPAVRAVITAMRDCNREAFFAAFAPSAELTDDGHLQPLKEWADREIFQAHGHLDVEREDSNGLELVGLFHSDQWDMKTMWRFRVIDGRIHRLDVAAL
ncbi:hypothetical protein [Nitrososphaera viennensis]|uniref:SnoaL-like domain-containing protein n=2 Tax=Nitrososphaera viennensis TaxID=1034015 RepID=A0A060HIK6_9ARCH|nr:hypothetical protein [Nitrososphaera viennensis]AIC15358.1 hypothetical protein NVIE_011270 [Nitrososphaera viennensis EN76]UVS70255.1 hypothetical protein NWT39_05565 [Nitrososphaera viennensis]